ncbi:MAG TPA: TlyA family RNA methyltransferase [Pseudolysinimonas sp.]|nr:TlyA family RNA methyltransferase [Pseudolysinimonas sp.]
MADVAARLDAELVRRGLARSRALAVAAIEEGRVLVDGRVVAKPATKVGSDAELAIEGENRYVSRAALKLIGALDAFDVDPTGRLALDVGASTGGFTQVLLERGARDVIALDVGHGQLAPSIRADPRVRVIEGVNARSLDAAGLAAASGTDERPDLVVADLSFISLTTVLPALVATVGSAADAAPVDAAAVDYILLVKPQFEVGRQGVREGIVRDRALRHDAVSAVVWAAWDAGLATAGIIPSPVLGGNGNQEYLLWARSAVGSHPPEWESVISTLP